MLPTQGRIQFSEHAILYDMLVPKNHVLRQINDLIDFSFVYEELTSKYCLDNGRMAEDPIRMFKYLLLKTIYTLSDVDVVEHSRYDLSYKYFLGMMPEDDVINPSSLCKFRRMRLKDVDLLDMLIGKTVRIAIEKGIIKSGTIIVDATHTASRSNPYAPVDILKQRSKLLRKTIYTIDENRKGTLPQKNEDADLEHELAYTDRLLTHLSSERKSEKNRQNTGITARKNQKYALSSRRESKKSNDTEQSRYPSIDLIVRGLTVRHLFQCPRVAMGSFVPVSNKKPFKSEFPQSNGFVVSVSGRNLRIW